MTDIREGIASITDCRGQLIGYEAADSILLYLRSQDVVKKVKGEIEHWCELCESSETIDEFLTCNNNECYSGNCRWKFKASYTLWEEL